MRTAIDHQITQIVLGTSKLSRWQSFRRGSVIQQILRMASAAAIDVHVIARLTERNGRAAPENEG
jgi:K+-sensing histidine kinase KdpD